MRFKLELKCDVCGKKLILPYDNATRVTNIKTGKSILVCEKCVTKFKNKNYIHQDLMLGF